MPTSLRVQVPARAQLAVELDKRATWGTPMDVTEVTHPEQQVAVIYITIV
jgi:hypothetical protein